MRLGELLKVSQATIYRWIALKRRGESLKPKENYHHGYNPKITDIEAFKSFVDENQGLTSLEMASKWGNIAPKTIRKWLHKIGYSCKKTYGYRERSEEKRQAYMEELKHKDPTDLIYLDETGIDNLETYPRENYYYG